MSSYYTPQLNLAVWAQNNDAYNHNELASNWTTIDSSLLRKNWSRAGDEATYIKFGSTANLSSSAIVIATTTGTASTNLWNITTGGSMSWGPGGTGLPDISIYRNATATLTISGNININQNFSVSGITTIGETHTGNLTAYNGYFSGTVGIAGTITPGGIITSSIHDDGSGIISIFGASGINIANSLTISGPIYITGTINGVNINSSNITGAPQFNGVNINSSNITGATQFNGIGINTTNTVFNGLETNQVLQANNGFTVNGGLTTVGQGGLVINTPNGYSTHWNGNNVQINFTGLDCGIFFADSSNSYVSWSNGANITGSHTWQASSRTMKNFISEIDLQDFLLKFDELPIQHWQWNEKNKPSEYDDINVGPFAEDFNKIFYGEERTLININQEIGVLYAVTKALRKEMLQLKTELGK